MSRSVRRAPCRTTPSELNDTARAAQGHYESGYVVTIGLMYFCVGAILASLCALLLADVMRRPRQHAAPLSSRPDGGCEARPLLASRESPATAHTLHMRGRRVGTKGEALSFRPAVEHRRAGLRDLSLLVLCFVVLFPLVIFCVLTLPDEFTEFTHWAVRHYEHAEYNQANGRVWNMRVSEALNLKLYPDLVWFYGVM